MARIEGIRIKNYRVLKDITLGMPWTSRGIQPLTPMTAVIGKNGVGKSSLFDAFGLLSDCLKLGVEEACDARGRGGFERIRTQGSIEPIEFEVQYREETGAWDITYRLAIDLDVVGRPYVAHETFHQFVTGESDGQILTFLAVFEGRGLVWRGATEGRQFDNDGFDVKALQKLAEGELSRESEYIELENTRRLGIATLGALKQHPRIASFCHFIEGWYLSYFTPDAARSLPLAGPQRRLNAHGDNLGNVVQFMEREHSG